MLCPGCQAVSWSWENRYSRAHFESVMDSKHESRYPKIEVCHPPSAHSCPNRMRRYFILERVLSSSSMMEYLDRIVIPPSGLYERNIMYSLVHITWAENLKMGEKDDSVIELTVSGVFYWSGNIDETIALHTRRRLSK